MGRYAHESWIPTVIPLVTEKDLRNELMGLYNVYRKSQDRNVVDPDTRQKLALGGFLMAAVKGTKTEFLVHDIRHRGDPRPMLLNTERLAKAVGDWDDDMRTMVHYCGHYTHIRFEEEEDGNAIGKCDLKSEEGGGQCYKQPSPDCGFVNKRFGSELPKPLTDIVVAFIREYGEEGDQ